jgi:2'-5' RNA ligase
VIGELSAIPAQFGSIGGALRWASPETWHITLQFLGSTTPEQYACIVERLGNVRSPAVPVGLEGIGFFDRAGVFFVDVHLTPELIALQQQVSRATTPCGFVPETRPYRPHITLARGKGAAGALGLSELKKKIVDQPIFSKFVAEEFLIYESFTRPTGSRYEIRHGFPLIGR